MRVLVIAPHPDDETLGCGGSLLKHKYEGDELYWCIVTTISKNLGWSQEAIKKRKNEIQLIGKKYNFTDVFNFKLPTTKIDTLPISQLVQNISDVYRKIEPEIIYMPFINDIHTDHQIVAKALQSTIKWFRHSYIKKVLMYETLSETENNFFQEKSFKPNVFVDISQYLDEKVEAMKIYESEIGHFPFPRSEKNIRALATVRGSQSGFTAAEAFELIYQRK